MLMRELMIVESKRYLKLYARDDVMIERNDQLKPTTSQSCVTAPTFETDVIKESSIEFTVAGVV